MRKKNESCRQFGLLGRSIQYSFSPTYFAEKFEKEDIQDAYYQLFDIEKIEDLPELLKENNLTGLNVTIPYKQEIIPYLDELDEVAREINAVNTVSFFDGILRGHNTDVTGFTEAVSQLIGRKKAKHALILGTGGASMAVQYALEKMGIQIQVVSRKSVAKSGIISYDNLDKKLLRSHRLIVNCTPLGTHPDVNSSPNIPYDLLTKKHLLFDLVYNPKKSLFLKQGENHGCSILNGYSMLVGQAEASWSIWNAF